MELGSRGALASGGAQTGAESDGGQPAPGSQALLPLLAVRFESLREAAPRRNRPLRVLLMQRWVEQNM